MPEGDTIFRAARTLNRALAGRDVLRFESPLPALTRIDTDRPLAGRRVESVASLGKHVLMHFSGDLVLRTHMRMNGSWHIYKRGEAWRRPRREMRVLIETDPYVAVGFNIPIAEFRTADELRRERALTTLGPDLLAAVFDAGDAMRRMRAHPREAVAEVILNQRVLSGIGNVFKSEVLFAARVDPFAPVEALPDDTLHRIVTTAHTQLRINVDERPLTPRPGRSRWTTGSMDPSQALWVYGRGGRPCRVCGTAIASRKTGPDARVTYWCPVCQAPA